MNDPLSRYKGRFAPSPTGPLHLGSLYTALAGFLEARARRGHWYVRIDDVDHYRTAPGATDRILYALDALGLHWDGAVLYQSQRLERYETALRQLRAEGWVYPCTCSRKELATLAPNGIYPGLCRPRSDSPPTAHALRIRTEHAHIAFDDALQGHIAQDLDREVGDFILYRRDGVYAYHLATVLDDAEQGITDVLRGIDLMDSTPRQIYLQQRLGLAAKTYAHIPILVGPNGQKLSKQNLAPEADTRCPSRLLVYLLELLRQNPPRELADSPAADILAWAIVHWDLTRLAGVQSLTVEPSGPR